MNRVISLLGLTAIICLAAEAGRAAAVQVPPPAGPPAQTAAATPPPQDNPLEFAGAVALAARLMDTDLPAAIEAIDRLALQSVEIRQRRSLTETERSVHRDLFLLQARGHLQLLDNSRVEASFRELLRIDPFFNSALTPREQTLMDNLRTQEGGFLEVSSNQPGASIVLNGIQAGITTGTPTRLTLLAGEYELRLEKEGFQPAVMRVTVPARDAVVVTDANPTRRIPPVVFVADREDVEVTVDSRPPARTVKLSALRSQLDDAENGALEQVLRGAQLDPVLASGFILRDAPIDRTIEVSFRRECHVEERRTVQVTAEAMGREPADPIMWFGDASVVKMQRDVGTLRVVSNVVDAEVFVDGQLAGRTPFEQAVCSGQREVRLRHKIGSFSATAAVARNRTAVVDAVLKPGIAFVGAVESVNGDLRPAAGLGAPIDEALTGSVRTYRAATRTASARDVPAWAERSAAELVAAADRNDAAVVSRLLGLARDSFDATLLLAAARRPAPAGGAAYVELMLFWTEHAGVDRVRWNSGSPQDLATILASIDVPAEGTDLVYQNDLGMRVVETRLPNAPLTVVRVDPGSSAAAAGIKVADSVETVEGAAVDAMQFEQRLREKKPGELVTLGVSTAGAPARSLGVALQRRPRRAPVFDPSYLGNPMIAKLNVSSLTTTNAAERDLLSFSLALAYMRFGDYKAAADILASLGNIPEGMGTGRGAVLYFRARCLELLGQREEALAFYRQAALIENQVFSDDGTTVAAVAKRRLAALAAPPP